MTCPDCAKVKKEIVPLKSRIRSLEQAFNQYGGIPLPMEPSKEERATRFPTWAEVDRLRGELARVTTERDEWRELADRCEEVATLEAERDEARAQRDAMVEPCKRANAMAQELLSIINDVRAGEASR